MSADQYPIPDYKPDLERRSMLAAIVWTCAGLPNSALAQVLDQAKQLDAAISQEVSR